MSNETIEPVIRGNAPVLEVFTGGCNLCAKALIDSLKLAEERGYSIKEDKIDGPRAQALGLRAAPTIVLNGEVLFPYAPSFEELAEKLPAVN